MIAETAKEKNVGTCGKCKKEKDLTQETKLHGQVCEDCYLEKFQIGMSFDEYDLQPNELTKEQVAEILQCSIRYVQMLVKKGAIPAQKLRRRVGGVVRENLIFKTEDIDDYKKEKDSPVELPTVVKEMDQTGLAKANTNEQNEMLTASVAFGLNKMVEIAESMKKFFPAAPVADAPPFLTLKEASEFTRLGQAEIKRLVDADILKSFKGSHGEILVSRKQLLEL
jgi:excisionase family DNA binding protein